MQNIKIQNLGYRTDFIFNQLDGGIEDKGEYIVARTKSNPNYFWGNLLLFKSPPQKGDLENWKKLFKKEFNDPRIYHMTFGWDCPEGRQGEIDEFLESGFEFEKSVVLTTSSVVTPPKFNDDVLVKPVDLNRELDRCVEIQMTSADEKDLPLSEWKDFYLKSMNQYKVLIDEGYGFWFGAYLDNLLVGSLGIFIDQDVARFQIVSTHKDFYRKGICSSLVYNSSLYALEKMKARTLVMVADTEYHAAKIYESVGFRPHHYQVGLCNKELVWK